LQLSPGAFVSDRFQGPWDRLGSQDSLNRSALKSLIAEGVFDRPMISSLDNFPSAAGWSGRGTHSCGDCLAVSPLRNGSPSLRRQKSLPHRLQTVADFLGPKVIWVFYPFAQAGRISLMSSDELNLRRINQDLLLRSLELRMSADMAGGNGVEIRFQTQ